MKSFFEGGNDDVDEPIDGETLEDAGDGEGRQHPFGRPDGRGGGRK